MLLLLTLYFLLSTSTQTDISAAKSVPQQQEDANRKQPLLAEVLHTQIAEEVAAKQEGVHGSGVAPSPRVAALYPVVDREDIQLKHRQIADRVMRLMPQRCTSLLEHFYVRYNHPESRGLGGKSTIILSGNVPDDEFRALFIHEFGHLLDLGCFQGTPGSGTTTFKDNTEQIWKDDPSVQFYRISWDAANVQRKGTQKTDFVSGYASWDPFEDFAESFAYYLLHREVFAERAQENNALAAKYLWFQTYLPTVPRVAKSLSTWDGNVPWDSTKLAYTWNPPREIVARR
ncbi:hypothetical protein COU76_05900 [Candidatus Peregrinibacteria bacterium CG10_big_fil_rev_8_21_14_0_10_49_10]|nr:MAG: hypothetical protein COU76_05900 [Candidatus Peregrinibacteria bacterium CG10_big_fil_rev_8_21_14_0_10_49_10]